MTALEQIDIELLKQKAKKWIDLYPEIEKVFIFEVDAEPDATEEMLSVCLCLQTKKELACVTKTRKKTGSQAKPKDIVKYEGPSDGILEFLSEPFLDFNLKEVSSNPSILWTNIVFWDYEEVRKYDPVQIYPSDQNVLLDDTLPAPAKTSELEKTTTANFFTREGDVWHIGFNGEKTRVKHLDGLLYISYLLLKPGNAISCQKLYQAVSGKDAANIMSEDVAISEGLNIGSGKQPVVDKKALAVIRKEYDDLGVELQHTLDNEMREEIEEKLKKLKPYLTRRNIPESNEKKVQVNIGKRLITAYEAIEKANMHELAKHLQDHIEPDGKFGLSYSGSITWEITL